MSKKKRHLVLAVASGCRHVIRPFCNHFSHWSPPSYSLWEVFTAVFYLYLSAVFLLYVPFYVFHLILYIVCSGQFSTLPLLQFVHNLKFCELASTGLSFARMRLGFPCLIFIFILLQ